MSDKPQLLVFSDLDGTLLDHQSYEWYAAAPALDALKSINAGLILASSKTAPEVAIVRAELKIEQWPAIVENGAGVMASHSDDCKEESQYRNLLSSLENISPSLRQHFTGFSDMPTKKVANITGLSVKNAALAKQRAFSEPGIWNGSNTEKEIFLKLLHEMGIHAQQGGRFLTLSYGANKADQLWTLAKQFEPCGTIALGDAPNDIAMLEAADIGVIVANPDAPPLPKLDGEAQGHIIRTKDAGPNGWNATILELISNPPFNENTIH